MSQGKVVKQGYLSKLGGGAGGHKNWKKRYFVLSEILGYFSTEESFKKGEPPLGKILLDTYYCCKTDTPGFEFTIHAYPRSLTCRAENGDDLDSWLKEMLKPLSPFGLDKIPE